VTIQNPGTSIVSDGRPTPVVPSGVTVDSDVHESPCENPLQAQSIVVIGPSRDARKTSGRTLEYLTRHGFEGRSYVVSAVHDEVLGIPTVPTVNDLPERPDIAVLVGPADRVIDDLGDCVDAGIPFAVAFASGFGEAGRRDREERIQAELQRGTTRLVGPNCIGFMQVERGLTATFSSVLQSGSIPAGQVALFTQSGGLGNALMQSLISRGVSGVSAWASSGNELSLGFTEWARWLTEEPTTRVLACIVESFRAIDDLEGVARAAEERGVPVVILKLGRSERGAAGAMSHTGKLAGSGRVAQSVLQHRFGMVCSSPEQLLDLGELFDVFHAKAAGEDHDLTIVTTSGAQAVLWNDLASDHDLTFETIEKQRLARIATAVGSEHVGNPVDVGVQSTTADYLEIVKSVVESSTGGWCIVTATRLAHDFDELVAGIAAMNIPAATRVVLVPLSEDDRVERAQAEVLRSAGAISLPSAGRALEAISAARSWAATQRNRSARGELFGAGIARSFDDDAQQLDWSSAAGELEAAGVPVPRSISVRRVEEAIAAAESIGYPVAIKIDDAAVLHKAAVGGVHLGVGDPDAVRAAVDSLTPLLTPDATISVQAMASGDVELLVGLRRDPEFGPVLVLGAGGSLTEVIDDVIILPLPVSEPEIRDAIRRIRLVAHRLGPEPEGTLDALVGVVRGILRWAEQRGDVHEFEFNPVLADTASTTATVVDAVASVRTVHKTKE
jgi:acetate---CoA ligase (ADP-forming)